MAWPGREPKGIDVYLLGGEVGEEERIGVLAGSREDAMTIEVFESVWDALEDTPTEAENMKLRSSLMIAISAAVSASSVSMP